MDPPTGLPSLEIANKSSSPSAAILRYALGSHTPGLSLITNGEVVPSIYNSSASGISMPVTSPFHLHGLAPTPQSQQLVSPDGASPIENSKQYGKENSPANVQGPSKNDFPHGPNGPHPSNPTDTAGCLATRSKFVHVIVPASSPSAALSSPQPFVEGSKPCPPASPFKPSIKNIKATSALRTFREPASLPIRHIPPTAGSEIPVVEESGGSLRLKALSAMSRLPKNRKDEIIESTQTDPSQESNESFGHADPLVLDFPTSRLLASASHGGTVLVKATPSASSQSLSQQQSQPQAQPTSQPLQSEPPQEEKHGSNSPRLTHFSPLPSSDPPVMEPTQTTEQEDSIYGARVAPLPPSHNLFIPQHRRARMALTLGSATQVEAALMPTKSPVSPWYDGDLQPTQPATPPPAKGKLPEFPRTPSRTRADSEEIPGLNLQESSPSVPLLSLVQPPSPTVVHGKGKGRLYPRQEIVPASVSSKEQSSGSSRQDDNVQGDVLPPIEEEIKTPPNDLDIDDGHTNVNPERAMSIRSVGSVSATRSQKRKRTTSAPSRPVLPRTTKATFPTAGPSSKRLKVDQPKLGTHVFAMWTDKHWHPGHVDHIKKSKYVVEFDDPALGTLAVDLSKMRSADLRVGDRVDITKRISDELLGDALVVDASEWRENGFVAVNFVEDQPEPVQARGIDFRIRNKTIAESWDGRLLQAREIVTTSAIQTPSARKLPPPRRRMSSFLARPSTHPSSSHFQNIGFVITGVTTDGLAQKIKDAGGTVFNQWDDLFHLPLEKSQGVKRWVVKREDICLREDAEPVDAVYLLADKACTTPKYLLALALGVPCIHNAWVDDYLESSSTHWNTSLLSAGRLVDSDGTEHADYSQWIDHSWGSGRAHLRDIVENPAIRRVFQDKTILCVTSKHLKDPDFSAQPLPSILCAMGAESVELVGELKSASKDHAAFDFVVFSEKERVVENGPLNYVDIAWLKKCLIVGKVFHMPNAR